MPAKQETPNAEVVSEVKEKEVIEDVDMYWSRCAPNHMLVVQMKEDGVNAIRAVTFRNYLLKVEKGSELSAAIQNHSAFGVDVYLVKNKPYPAKSPARVSFHKRIRATVSKGRMGVSQLRALFTNKELVEAGLTATADDIDALTELALSTKSIGEIA